MNNKDYENREVHPFFAMMARMKYIDRWALMKNSATENISEHSMEVAMLAHGLGIISIEKCDNEIDLGRLTLMALYHDANEILTGDMPTPVKYLDEEIKSAYKKVELRASYVLIRKLPDYMRKYYEDILIERDPDRFLWRLVKAADKFSALIKCIEEKKSGNHEFDTAYESTLKYLEEMDMEEIRIFMRDFLPCYEKTLDQLQTM